LVLSSQFLVLSSRFSVLGFTGQRRDATGWLEYHARYDVPTLGRFISPERIVPEPGNPQSLNRYAYVYNNPLKYVDPDGHAVFIPLLIVGGVIALKALDYGWTAWDADQATRTLADPHASVSDKAAAASSLARTAACEAAEPDDLIPIVLPLDDLVRVGIIGGVRKAGQETTGNISRDTLLTALQGRLKHRPIQTHHILSNKHTTKWTAQFERIVKPYGLDLDGARNRIAIPHRGPHPEQYHEWLLEEVRRIDQIAKGNTKEFLTLFNERIRKQVEAHPEMLFKEWWK